MSLIWCATSWMRVSSLFRKSSSTRVNMPYSITYASIVIASFKSIKNYGVCEHKHVLSDVLTGNSHKTNPVTLAATVRQQNAKSSGQETRAGNMRYGTILLEVNISHVYSSQLKFWSEKCIQRVNIVLWIHCHRYAIFPEKIRPDYSKTGNSTPNCNFRRVERFFMNVTGILRDPVTKVMLVYRASSLFNAIALLGLSLNKTWTRTVKSTLCSYGWNFICSCKIFLTESRVMCSSGACLLPGRLGSLMNAALALTMLSDVLVVLAGPAGFDFDSV